jgi:hypothetical protein
MPSPALPYLSGWEASAPINAQLCLVELGKAKSWLSFCESLPFFAARPLADSIEKGGYPVQRFLPGQFVQVELVFDPAFVSSKESGIEICIWSVRYALFLHLNRPAAESPLGAKAGQKSSSVGSCRTAAAEC